MSSVNKGDWVVVIYEQEKFIEKVMNIVNGQAAVQCLTKSLGVNILQVFEKDDYVYYETVYYTSITPKLVQVGRGWKWIY